MNCPSCEANALKVIDSRESKDRRRRRYECQGCGARESSVETWVIDGAPDGEISDRALLAEIATRLGVRL